MIDVMRLLGQRRPDYAERIDELAERLVAGEKIGRDEVVAILGRLNCTPEELQHAVDRLTRRAELLGTIRAAAPARKRFDTINLEIAEARAEYDRAAARLEAIRDKHRMPLVDLQGAIMDADKAEAALVDPKNLPPKDAERLVAVRRAADEASGAIDTARRELPDLERQVEEAEQLLTEQRETLALHRDDPQVKEQVSRAVTRCNARRERLKQARAGIEQLEKALVTARRERDRVQAEVKARYGSANN